jgi:NAD(P)-dependent dehydrogenase (short-subunit alcohol dehydrogenase family)
MDSAQPSLLITGAGGVLGRAVLKRLVEDPEFSSCRFVAISKNPAKLEALGAFLPSERLVLKPLDLSDSSHEWMKIVHDLSPWRGAVLAAGISLDQILVKMNEKVWDDFWRVNLKVNAALLSALGRPNCLAHNASVVLVSSVVSAHGNAGQTAYAASKGGLTDLMEVYQSGLAKVGCRLNVLFPPLMESPLLAGLSEEARARLFSQRLVADEDPSATCASHIAFLLSHRSSYVHASVWQADTRVLSWV